MQQYLEAFLLGNAAILGNVCVLPLYPGLLAFLASQGQGEAGQQRQTGWFGLLVLAGVLSLMLVIGLIFYLLRQSVTTFLPVLLPSVYIIVLLLGILLLVGINPFKRLASAQAPVLRNPYITAYIYGLLLGPMTLPCTGPLIISAFVLGGGNAFALADGILYFLAFGLGFGWPLVALSLVAASSGRQMTRWFAQREPIIQRLSGVLLVGIALFGVWVDVVPNIKLPSTRASAASIVRTTEVTPMPQTNAPQPTNAASSSRTTSNTSQQPIVTEPRAPELRGITHWLNSNPLTMADLRGQVVMVHFWTFACYNCTNTLPYVTAWYNTYHDQGFTVIGVHAPEFGFERETANVADAAKRFGITYPIAQDNDFATWKAYNNRYWPTLYLIDTNGVVRYSHIGEGAYQETEEMIQRLLGEG